MEAARQDARRDADRFHWPDNAQTEAAVQPPVNACFKAAPEGSRRRFTVYLRLSADGHVSRALVEPESPFAACFRDQVARATFSRPPKDGIWLEVEMAMDKAPAQ